MSTNLQKLLNDALLNNTYDYTALHETLKDTWENSYSYLYTLQKKYVEYEEFHYTSNDTDSRDVKTAGHLFIDSHLRASFNVEYDFINICNRDEFYRSSFYTKEFTFNDMVKNPQIFNKVPIVIIDDKTIWDYTLNPYNGNDYFTISLPFGSTFVVNTKRNPTNDNYIYNDHKIQVLTVDNVFYTRFTVNKTYLNMDDTNHTISIDTSLLNHEINENGIYCISLHLSTKYQYQLGTMLSFCEVIDNRLVCSINDSDFKEIKNYYKDIYVSVIYIDELYHHYFYTDKTCAVSENGESNLFILQQDELIPYAMPIPVEDLIIIRKRDNKFTLLKNVDTVEMFYPNIYRIKTTDQIDGDEFYIHYFYHPEEFLQYSPLYDYYYEFLSIHFRDKTIEEIIDTIYRGTIDLSTYPETTLESFKDTFKKILEYQYYNHRYGEIDFYKRYTVESDNNDKLPVEYKDETLRDWIAIDPYVLRDYVINQNRLYGSTYHMWTNAINLTARLRNDTRSELRENGYDLDEPCYVFSFRNDNTKNAKMLDLRVFVDGLFIVNTHQVRHYFMDYIYIPVKDITNDSYIELEIFPSYEYNTKLNFTSLNDVQEITLLEPSDQIFPNAEDLYYMNPSGHTLQSGETDKTEISSSDGSDTVSIKTNQTVTMIVNGQTYEETHIYNDTWFGLTASYDDGDFEIKTTDEDKPVKFTRLSKFKVQPLSKNVLNKDISLNISKIPNGIEVLITKQGFPYLALVENKFKFNIEYLRIFVNGRLIPRTKYVFFTTYSFPRIYLFEWCEPGDFIYIDITPYRYKEIYYQEELKEKDTLINLKDIITKPFDIRYYDVYLNGRKLSLNNVFTISPWEITLTNLVSRYHLQIFEKERDYEFYGTNYKENNYYYTIDDLFKESFVSEEEKNEIIKNMIDKAKEENMHVKPNENTEDKMDFEDNRRYAYYHMFYFDELIPKTYVNPDRIQFDNTILEEEYPTIYNMYKVTTASFARNEEELIRRRNYMDVLKLNPDIHLEGKAGKGTQYVYCVGHTGDDVIPYLQEKIVINNDPNIDKEPE